MKKKKESINGVLIALLIIISYSISLSSASVIFKPLGLSFSDLPARYAGDVDNTGICGALHVSDPLNGCSPLRNRFDFNETAAAAEVDKKFAILIRGDCSFEQKIKNVQGSGFQAAIVHDDRDKSSLIYMMVNPDGINIPAVFISKHAGEVLAKNARGVKGECCIYPPEDRKARAVLAISCLSLLMIIGILVMVFFIPRHWMYWRMGRRNNNLHHQGHHQDQRRCVDSRSVEALPHFKFCSSSSSSDSGKCSRSGERETTCAICLEDYKDFEVIKVLPCEHNFHSGCVDSWLTKWGTFCPVCKLDIRTKLPKPEVKRGICPLELPWRMS